MNTKMILGILLSLVCIVTLGVVIGFLVKTNADKNRYDERQKIVQGKGYKISFWVLVAYIAVYAFLDDTIFNFVDSQIIVMFVGLCVSVVANAIYCIFKDAYISYKEKIGRIYLVLGGIALSNAVISVSNYLNQNSSFFNDGKLSLGFLNVICVIFLVIVMIALAIKQLIDKKAESKEES